MGRVVSGIEGWAAGWGRVSTCNANGLGGHALSGLGPARRFQVNRLVVAPPDRNDNDDQVLVDHLVDQPIAHVTELDFVGVLQVAAQPCRRYMGRLETLGELLLEERLDRPIVLAPFLQRCLVEFQLIGPRASP